jgi:hypothetical protein
MIVAWVVVLLAVVLASAVKLGRLMALCHGV